MERLPLCGSLCSKEQEEDEDEEDTGLTEGSEERVQYLSPTIGPIHALCASNRLYHCKVQTTDGRVGK